MVGRQRALVELGTDLVAEAMNAVRVATRYPLGWAAESLTSGRPGGDQGHDTPVVLVHGYGHNRSGWWVLQRHLRQAGFTNVPTFNYRPTIEGVPELALRLAARVEEIRSYSQAGRVHVVGHSLGGILMRWYVDELGGDRVVDTAVTLATPHRGMALAVVAPGRTGHDLRPGSDVMQRLTASRAAHRSGPVRWISYGGQADLLVRSSTVALSGAVNILVPGVGHLGLLLSARVAASVTQQLEAAEGVGSALGVLASGCGQAGRPEPAVSRLAGC